MQAKIFDIKRFSIHDGQGIRTTVFLKGCPLSCIWCHNPEGICPDNDIWISKSSCIRCGTCKSVCPTNAISMGGEGYPVIDRKRCVFCNKCIDVCPTSCIGRLDRTITADELLAEVLKDKLFYDISNGGVTLTGGEPMMQHEFVATFFCKAKQHAIHTCLETSMHCSGDALKSVMDYTDHMFVDIKFIDNAMHCKYTGISNEIILNNFATVASCAKRLTVRVPLIPGITATKENIEGIVRFVGEINPKVHIELLNFNQLGISKYRMLGREYPCEDLKPLDADTLSMLKAFAEHIRKRT